MKIECSLESHTGGWGAEVGRQFLERGEGEGFVLGLGWGGSGSELRPLRSDLDSASCWEGRTAAGRQTGTPAGAATWRACAATPRASLGGAAAGRGGAASPSPAPSRAEFRGAGTQERGETLETPGRAGDPGSGPGTGGWTWLSRTPG